MIYRFRLLLIVLLIIFGAHLRPVRGMTAVVSSSSVTEPNNRPCEPQQPRKYKSRYRGIGYEILNSESEACFVPDQEYHALDEIVSDVLARTKYDASLKTRSAQREQAERISLAVSDAMTRHGFELHVDTETLSDSLIESRRSGSDGRYIYDCDTGSFIFLTVAENLKAPVAMVEIPNGNSEMEHNYVRWLLNGESLFEWDMNLRSSRSTPDGLTGNYGKSMSRQATLGYALSLRAKLWKRQKLYDRAISDYLASMKTYPGL